MADDLDAQWCGPRPRLGASRMRPASISSTSPARDQAAQWWPRTSSAAPHTAVPPAPAAESAHSPSAPARTKRRAIADLMSRSKREIPHYYLGHDVSFQAAQQWLSDLNADRPAARRVLPIALVLQATAQAVGEIAGFNGFWIDDEFRPADSVNLGVAIAQRGGGLLAPCIHDADTLDVDDAGMADHRRRVCLRRECRVPGALRPLGDGHAEVHGVGWSEFIVDPESVESGDLADGLGGCLKNEGDGQARGGRRVDRRCGRRATAGRPGS